MFESASLCAGSIRPAAPSIASENEPSRIAAPGAGKRVPVRTFLKYLEAGDPLDESLLDLPCVTRDQAVAVLKLTKELLLARLGVEQPVTVDGGS